MGKSVDSRIMIFSKLFDPLCVCSCPVFVSAPATGRSGMLLFGVSFVGSVCIAGWTGSVLTTVVAAGVDRPDAPDGVGDCKVKKYIAGKNTLT